MSRHTVFGNDTPTLVFETDEEYQAYQRDIWQVQQRHLGLLRAKYGIWASNQGKYVASEADLNAHDARR